MSDKFEWKRFSQVNLRDPFFDSLRSDYIEFDDWFQRKSGEGESAMVLEDDLGVAAFVYLKRENEPILLCGSSLPQKSRIKIGTLKLSERIRSKRLGEGALGVALWYWQKVKCDEIYVTAFDKHYELIRLFERFGFENVGKNKRGESVFLKSRNHIDYGDPYKCFPFLSKDIKNAGLIPINDDYHDRLFPYSELYGTDRDIEGITAGNGITKVFIAAPTSKLFFKEGMPVFVYRKYTGSAQKAFKSVITSLCTVSKITIVKDGFVPNMTLEEFIEVAGNKTVYQPDELSELYKTKKNIIAIELVYNTYFGKGHNVNYATLKDNGLFEKYPYEIIYSKKEIEKILELGDKNVQDIIID